MRIDVKKFLFIGIEEDKKSFFKQAQELGVINFAETKSRSKEIPAEIQQFSAAIKVLRGLPTLPQEELEVYALADGLVHKILQKKHSLEKLYEDLRTTKLEIARVAVFGDFSKEDIDFIEREGKRKVQFFFAKGGTAAELPLPDEVIYVGTEYGLDYFVSINPEAKQYDKLVEMRIEHPIGELRQRYAKLEREIHETEHALKPYAKYNRFLHEALIEKLNVYHLQSAEHDVQTALEDTLFSVIGWIPENKIPEVEQLVEKMHVHMSEVAIEPADVVPTYLENEGINRIGEDVIGIYDVPSTTDKDPSLWVLISFALFFAIIVGDAGYGAVFLAIALYIRYKFSNLKGAKQRTLNLVTMLCFTTIAWGILTNSFFGFSFPPESPMRKISLINWLVEKKTEYHITHRDATYAHWVEKFPQLQGVTDPKEFMHKASTIDDGGNVSYALISKFSDNIMMELALFIGVVHIILSMLRYVNRNWAFVGWIAFIIGGYLYIPKYLDATSLIHFVFGIDKTAGAESGLYLIYGGIAVAVVLGLVVHKLMGVFEIMTAVQIFADIMSYLRLYALGLAGAMVMATLNESAQALNIVFAGILIIVGHVLNMALSIMGGVIHGLRLNFLEWYHWSFEGGGKQFKPLKKIQIE